MNVIILFILSFILSTVITYLLLHHSSWLQILDHPNERSLHSSPTPRGGGIAILIAIVVGGVLLVNIFNNTAHLIWVMAIMLIVAVISFLDDRYTLSPVYRFPVHLLAAALLIYGGYSVDSLHLPGIIWHWSSVTGIIFTTLFVVWSLNLYNFMDGMDGFAAGMAIVGFGTMALIGWIAGRELFFATNLIVFASVAGFLIFNFPPARIFMGDVGSSTLGLLVAGFALWAERESILPLWVSVLIFSPFIVDATVTLFRRILRGERIWEAHRSHYYQRLVQMGWSHRKTVLYEYIIMVLSGGSAILAMYVSVTFQWIIIIVWTMIYAILMLIIDKAEANTHA